MVEHNKSGKTWTKGVTKFADLTSEEFKKYYTGFNDAMLDHKFRTVSLPTDLNASTPEEVDWRKKAETPVKNQEQCGSCWAFSTIECLESREFLKGYPLTKLSPQQLVNCDTVDHGCQGGLMQNAFNYIKTNGIVAATTCPYTGQNDTCDSSLLTQIVFNNVTGYTMVQQNTNALMNALVDGPVSVAVDANLFQTYTGGVITNAECGTQLDHGVVASGYTQDKWIVRNSWGPDWGDNGYVYLQKGDGMDTCGVLENAVYPTLGENHIDPHPKPPTPTPSDDGTCQGHCGDADWNPDYSAKCWCCCGCDILKNCCKDFRTYCPNTPTNAFKSIFSKFQK